MKFASRRTFLSVLSVAAVLSTSSSFAQDRVAQVDSIRSDGPCHCSHPVNVHIKKNSNPTPNAADFGSQYASKPVVAYNDNGKDHYFRDTIKWNRPATKTCEYKGTIRWTVVNNAKNGLQSNDTSWAMLNGAAIPGMGGPVGALAPNATKTFGPYNLTNAIIQSGQISVGLQDDTAMKEIIVDIEGCCIQISN